jgi:putative ATPase
LIGATTENPSFEVISPLLSRSRVLVLEPLSKEEVVTILKRTAKKLGATKRVNKKVLDYIAELSGGDARIAIGNLELSLDLAKDKVDLGVVKTAAQKKIPGYDKAGEKHFDLISAFIKSMRGSDANAALYYMARMLEAGEDPKFIARRMVIFASEDVGLASSPALNLAVSTFMAVERIGMPESSYNLFHCAVVLSASKKSRVLADAMQKAYRAARDYPDLRVPIHLRNAPTKLMKDLGYGGGYEWQADFKHKKGFLPDELKSLDLF